MILTGLSTENWLCYGGATSLALGPLAYAIVATREGDAEASNYAGKSGLLEAVWFGLTGEHRWAPFADRWITEGEDRGGVSLAFDEGTILRRWREPGKSTQLEVTAPGLDRPARQDEAQALLWRRVGMSAEDLKTCSYLEQGGASAFVTADPGPRTQMVVGWLRLEPLQRAHAAAGEELAKIERDRESARGRAIGAAERAKEAWGELDPDDDAALQALQLTLEERVRLSDEVVEEATERAAEAGMAALYDAKRGELAATVAEGKKLRAEHDAADPAKLKADLDAAARAELAARAEASDAERVWAARRTVARGTFDGACPVAGIACPVQDEINRMSEHGKAESKAAGDALAAARARVESAVEELSQARRRQQAHEKARDRLVELGTRAKALKKTLEGAPETRVSDSGSGLLEAQRASISARRELDAFRARMDVVAREEAAFDRADEEAKSLEKRAATLREARAVLGRSGAQRRLAEGALGSIEGEANFVLESCGVGLSLRLTWEREGKQPADECPKCGRSFPASAKAKACEECGELRGRNRVQRLDVELSRVSGAAKDLGGLATAMGAAAWLRARRSSPWGIAMLDEPLAAADRRNRRLVGGQLSAMLGLAGFAQSFVVSHDPQAVAALPGRIVVTSDGRRSRAEVAA